MPDTGITTILLIIANFAFSYKGFTNHIFFEGYKFEVDKILIKKDYLRLVSSGFFLPLQVISNLMPAGVWYAA